jgi:hypothetical protein
MPIPVSHPYDGQREALGGMSQTFNNVAINIARMRYQRAMNEQRMAMAQAQLALRQQMQQQEAEKIRAQIGEYVANARNHGASADMTAAKMGAADQIGSGMQNRYMQQRAAAGAAVAPEIGPPTPDEQADQSMGALYGNLAKSAALQGHAGQLLLPQTVGPNQIRSSPLDGSMVSQGPTVLNPGQQYQLPGSQPVINPRMMAVNPGQVLVNSNSGEDVAYGLPKAQVDPNKSTAVDAALIRSANEDPDEALRYPTAKPGQQVDPARLMNYQALTNALGRASSPHQSMVMPPRPTKPQQAPVAASQSTSGPVEEFGSEEEARASGKKKGDYIKIRGVGEGYLE